jgi:hypothetical protein
VAAHVLDRFQADGRPVDVERVAERAVEERRVPSPQLTVVGRRGLRDGGHGRRVVHRRQHRRAVRGEDVRDVHQLGHGASGYLQGRRGHDDVAALGRRRDRLELGGDRVPRQLPHLLG